MTALTCDYNGHKEIYTADGKITPPLALLTYEKFLFRVSTTKERLKFKLSQSLEKPQSLALYRLSLFA
ncbi:hypothetical protein OQE27_001725 [Campylobacter upsaliensis]|nr:hypothetical protein [Campylobacter upsaliensis]